jgi:hypothetical protein
MIKVSVEGATVGVETDALQALVRAEGYTTGVAAGSLVDKHTGARDLGFGLSIVDFLLEPVDAARPTEKGQYEYGGGFVGYHGDIPKRYVEGPQVCTQAKKLPFQIIEGDGFLVVRQWFTWHEGYAPYRAGSRWEQTLVFTERDRFFFSSDRVTTVNNCSALFLRIDMPGHIKHTGGDTFEHIYLSYADAMLPATDFLMDFPPDSRNLYQRGRQPMPQRFVRAYQTRVANRRPQVSDTRSQVSSVPAQVGPWLAGITLEPTDVYEAWCHQRGYVCMIEEIGGWPTQSGDTFGAAYIVGWFDALSDLNRAADRFRGWSGIDLIGPAHRPTSFVGVKQQELRPVSEVSNASRRAGR